jgi:hypothetical protein
MVDFDRAYESASGSPLAQSNHPKPVLVAQLTWVIDKPPNDVHDLELLILLTSG